MRQGSKERRIKGDQTKINGKPLFSVFRWTLSAKPYRPDTMKGTMLFLTVLR